MAVQSCAYDRCTCKFQEGNGLEREGRLFCDDYCVGSLNPENFDSAAFDSGAFDTLVAAGVTVDIRVADS